MKLTRQLAGEALAGHEGAVVFSEHADEQIGDLGVDRLDVVTGLARARSCRWQPEQCTWKVQVGDAADTPFAVIVDIQDDGPLLVVVTVFE